MDSIIDKVLFARELSPVKCFVLGEDMYDAIMNDQNIQKKEARHLQHYGSSTLFRLEGYQGGVYCNAETRSEIFEKADKNEDLTTYGFKRIDGV